MTASRSSSFRSRWPETLALGLLLFGVGCTTPEARYRVLSFFFDGVPRPGAAETTSESEEGVFEVAPTFARSPVPAPEIFRHDPDCDECHGDRSSKRLIAPRDQICWECHDREDFEGEVVHGPFASNNCLECHNPHRSKYPPLLLRAGAELCESCHDGVTFPGAEAHAIEHEGDCIDCHNPHAADEEYMLEDG